jgi:hypothetical protein
MRLVLTTQSIKVAILSQVLIVVGCGGSEAPEWRILEWFALQLMFLFQEPNLTRVVIACPRLTRVTIYLGYHEHDLIARHGEYLKLCTELITTYAHS